MSQVFWALQPVWFHSSTVRSPALTLTLVQTYRRPSPADAGDHGGAWLLPFPVWLQLGVRAALRSFLVDLFVPKIKLRERERVCHCHRDLTMMHSSHIHVQIPANLSLVSFEPAKSTLLNLLSWSLIKAKQATTEPIYSVLIWLPKFEGILSGITTPLLVREHVLFLGKLHFACRGAVAKAGSWRSRA